LDEVYGDSVQIGLHAAGVTIREVHSGNGGQDFQPHWRNTHPNDLPRLLKHGGIGLGETEASQDSGYALSIIGADRDPNVEVGSGTRETVVVDSVAPDDEVLDITRVQQLQELSEVGW
jgi:hypothetical protein